MSRPVESATRETRLKQVRNELIWISRLTLAAAGLLLLGEGLGFLPHHAAFDNVVAWLLVGGAAALIGVSARRDRLTPRAQEREVTAEHGATAQHRANEEHSAGAEHGVAAALSGEKALRRSEEWFRRLFEVTLEAIVISNTEGIITDVNPRATQLFGYARDEMVGQPVEMLMPAAARDQHRRQRSEFNAAPRTRALGAHLDLRGLTKDGRELPLEISLSPMHTADGLFVLSAIQDISERRKLEHQLQHAQKMEAIGRLAGGIAHDFNNLLVVIMSFSTFLRDALAEDDPARDDVEEVLNAADRAAALTNQLLAFSRRQIINPKVMRLNDHVLATDKMLRRVLGEDIELVTLPAAEAWNVRIDPSQLEQVLVNLAVNARDAMPGGGKLTIETTNIELYADYANEHPDVQPGPYVMLAVSDNGCGMPPEVREKVFEPFFTTKERGKGTGLGLATCYGIVKQAGGHVWVYSEVGHGTTFKIYLPRVSDAAAESAARRETAAAPRGSETVLVVEDEPAVRAIAARALRQHGYDVLEADNGDAALQLCNAHPGAIDLMLTDVVMPQIGGRQLAERVLQLRPELRVLYMSGYTDNAIVHHGVLDPNTAFIQKPFMPRALVRKVRDVLDAPKPAASAAVAETSGAR